MTKTKKEKVPADGEEAAAAADGTEKSYQELVANVNPIAQPLASKKLSKKLYKCVKKGTKASCVSPKSTEDPHVLKVSRVRGLYRRCGSRNETLEDSVDRSDQFGRLTFKLLIGSRFLPRAGSRGLNTVTQSRAQCSY